MANGEEFDLSKMEPDEIRDLVRLISRAKELLGEDYTKHLPEIEAALKEAEARI